MRERVRRTNHVEIEHAGIIITTSALALTTAFGWHALSARSRTYKYVTLATALGTAVVGVLYLR